MPLKDAVPGVPGTPRILDNGLGQYVVGRPLFTGEQGVTYEYAPDPEQTLERAATLIRRERFSTPTFENTREFPVTRRLAYAAFEDTRPKYQLRRREAENSEETMQFEEYNGWPNFPSWSVFTVMTSYYETYQELEHVADTKGTQGVARFVKGAVEAWRNNQQTPHEEATKILVQDFLMNGVRRVDWTPVYDTLRGERQALGDADEVTTLAYDLLQKTDWRSIVAEAEYLTEADSMLRDWLQDQCITWVEKPDARRYAGSVGKFANTVLDTYFQAVKWEEVTDALRGT